MTLRQGRERAEVARFTRTLDEVVRSLKEIDEVYVDRATRPVWILGGVRHSGNSLIIRLTPREAPLKRELSDMLVPVQALVDGARTLEREPAVPRLFQPTTVNRIADLSAPHEGVRSVSLATYNGRVGRRVELSDKVKTNALAAVQPNQTTYGTVVGRVFAVGELRKRRVLKLAIRDENRNEVVEAVTPESLESAARDAWRHRVIVGGEIRLNARGQAVRIDVDRLERMPEDNSGRPAVGALLGSVSTEILGGLSVDEFLDRMRG
ncbi:hypothetical protein ABLE94_06390 [Gordonia sp. VNK1]|uniref:hypothetical protein n=1 Tax=Gordonia oleivorans TaxID=3156618 RepID=UPI0032B3D89D